MGGGHVVGAAAAMITPAPLPALLERSLVRRQSADDIFNARRCGYMGEAQASPILCPTNQVCLNNEFNRRGCCFEEYPGACTLPETCLDYTAYLASCDVPCQYAAETARCAESQNPYCGLLVYTDDPNTSYTMYYCFDQPSQTSLVGTTFAREQDITPGGPTTTGSPEGGGDGGGGGGGGSGLSQGAIIAIAVCTSVVGLALIGLVAWLVLRRSRRAAPPPQSSSVGGSVPPMAPSLSGPYAGSSVVAKSEPQPQQDFRAYDENFRTMDDDAVARLRRLSNDGTVDPTVVARTNDVYRPQAP